jgi:hypothetical protein
MGGVHQVATTFSFTAIGRLFPEKNFIRSFPAMKIPTHGALRFANGTLRRVNCFVKIS